MATVLTAVAWASTRGIATDWAVATLVCSYALWLGWRTRRPRRWQLTWDGQDWWLVSRAADALEPPDSGQRGEMAVALDLGTALLLRFSPAGDAPLGALNLLRRPRPVWLPLQRDGLPQQWHGLRCALYSPLPRPRVPEGGS